LWLPDGIFLLLAQRPENRAAGRTLVMTKGLLQITGTIDIAQFWPANQSDGDTVKVMVSHDGFKFSTDGSTASLKVTHVFSPPMVVGAETKPVAENKIIVRLEHIDCAELHYMVPKKGTKNFRQYFGETAATKLHDLLASTEHQLVPCKVRTFIDHPNQAFDTYGRLVGSIFITLHKEEVNVNQWLVQNGFAFPAFYNLAHVDEIKQFTKLAEEAQSGKKGLWPFVTRDLSHSDFSMVFRPEKFPYPEADIGPVVMPKMFRRLVAWHMAQIDDHFKGTFRDFLTTQKEDCWVKTSEFLHTPNIKPFQTNLSTLVSDKEVFELGPADLVFFEKESMLVDADELPLEDAWWPPVKTKTARGAA
jgi:endonuclease YncB( thermonuclease family)